MRSSLSGIYHRLHNSIHVAVIYGVGLSIGVGCNGTDVDNLQEMEKPKVKKSRERRTSLSCPWVSFPGSIFDLRCCFQILLLGICLVCLKVVPFVTTLTAFINRSCDTFSVNILQDTQNPKTPKAYTKSKKSKTCDC